MFANFIRYQPRFEKRCRTRICLRLAREISDDCRIVRTVSDEISRVRKLGAGEIEFVLNPAGLHETLYRISANAMKWKLHGTHKGHHNAHVYFECF